MLRQMSLRKRIRMFIRRNFGIVANPYFGNYGFAFGLIVVERYPNGILITLRRFNSWLWWRKIEIMHIVGKGLEIIVRKA